jgi:alkanesulfonate monooxygenase SsuD/methylene tetrahydromethanopterin reductase-like flavin-dependent oxidoreductase (luciferase family)
VRCSTPLGSLAYIGARHERIGLRNLLPRPVAPLHHPVDVAKRAATLLLCGDRLRLGIGVGWHEPEFEFLGLDFADRGRRRDEAIRLMRALWRGEAGFEGRYWSFSDARFGPLPDVEPQLWIGGLSQRSLRRAREHGATWHPESADPVARPPDQRGWADGRVAARLRVPFADSDAYLAGPPEQVASRLEALIEAGLDGAVLGFGSEPAEIVADMRRFSEKVWPRLAQHTSAGPR